MHVETYFKNPQWWKIQGHQTGQEAYSEQALRRNLVTSIRARSVARIGEKKIRKNTLIRIKVIDKERSGTGRGRQRGKRNRGAFVVEEGSKERKTSTERIIGVGGAQKSFTSSVPESLKSSGEKGRNKDNSITGGHKKSTGGRGK